MIDLNKERKLITKEEIYKHIQDIDVFKKYINEDIDFKKPINSPLMKDNKPSLGFFIGESNEICFNDFRIGKGDCIRFVQLLFGISYFEALSQIAIDFGISDDYIVKNLSKTNYENNKSDLSREEILSSIGTYDLKKKSRDWKSHDIFFWNQFGISKKTLDFFNVQPIEYIFINEKIIKADKCAYCFIEYKDNKETYKIYQPYSKFKWLNSHDNSIWQGWNQLPDDGTDLIITKSLKDVMSIYEITGIPSVSLQSENILPKKHVLEQLKSRFMYIYSLYDNDFDSEQNWGKIFGKNLASEFNLIELYIPDEYKSKDFSDLVKKYGKDFAKDVMENNLLMPF